jgi:hypothetical protein
MIRFHCPLCGKKLKVAEANAGKPITCRGCRQRRVAPEASEGPETGADGGLARPAQRADGDQAPGFFAGMSGRMRRGVILLAVAAPLGLLLGILQPFLPGGGGVSDTAAQCVTVLSLCSVALLFTILYGQGTGCPSCGRWWSRMRYGTELADREVFDRKGVSFGKSRLRTTYVCKECGHRWQVTETEEYRAPAAGELHRPGR